jgi:thiol-disulfide isomerase/thioredoxin
MSGIIARLIISVELALGLLLITNIYFKIVYKLTLYLLLFFSLFLAFKLIVSSNENCNCFGELINFNPAESLLKNFIFIILLFFIKNNGEWRFAYRKFIFIIILVITFASPSIVSPPDIIYRKIYPVNYNLQGEQFIEISDSTLNIAEGKKVLAFFSTKCKYCLLAAHKISIIADKTNTHDKIYYIFFGDEKDLEDFWTKSQSKRFSYTFIPFNEAIKITDGQFPSIFFVEDGYLKQKTAYRNLTEKQFIEFFP